MLHIINTWLQSRIVREDEGATMVEYGLMVALIAVAAVGAAGLLSDEINGAFSKIVDAISSA